MNVLLSQKFLNLFKQFSLKKYINKPHLFICVKMFNCFRYLFIAMKLTNVLIILEKLTIESIYSSLLLSVAADNTAENWSIALLRFYAVPSSLNNIILSSNVLYFKVYYYRNVSNKTLSSLSKVQLRYLNYIAFV